MTKPLTGSFARWPSSAELREQYKNQKVLLSFSRGKDSLACWLAMLDAGWNPDNIFPVYYYRIPGLRFQEESLAYYEEKFGRHILRMPHPSLYAQLANMVYQPPTRAGVIEACDWPTPTYEDLEELVHEHYGLPSSTMTMVGSRGTEGIARPTKVARFGPVNEAKRKVWIIWDWYKGEVYDRIERSGIKLPPDYEWFATPGRARSGRTFDGLAWQFLGPLKQHAPDDYATVLRWFPMVDAEEVRYEHLTR